MNKIVKIIAAVFSLQMMFALYSCNKCSVCNEALTDEEKGFICYKYPNNKILARFKNNVSGALDTLKFIDESAIRACSQPQGCPEYINDEYVDVSSPLGLWYILVSHNHPPLIRYSNSNFTSVSFTIDMPTQTQTINGTVYNDIFSMEINPATISNQNANRVPWKTYYSRAFGFVCFIMKDGSYWYKL